jgi:3-carboxy-cis,cis-muconate cycloisomerase
MSVSPFDHPILSSLLGDAEIAVYFSVDAEITAMLSFESALAQAEAAEGLIPKDHAERIADRLRGFVPDRQALAEAVADDGVVVPELVAQLRRAVGGEAARSVHWGSTSQDVIDSAAFIRLSRAAAILGERLSLLLGALDALAKRSEGRTIDGHTRMQIARPIAIAHKLDEWRSPLARLWAKRPPRLPVQLGGAVGNRAELGDKAQAVADRVADALGLERADRASHADRDRLAELAHWLSAVTGILGKLGQDVALMAQNEVAQITLASGGKSSAMPGKCNPVKAEVLVTLARFNSTQLSGVHSALVHEYERSGAAWTLEWMLLPQMAVATGAALRTALALVGEIGFTQG